MSEAAETSMSHCWSELTWACQGPGVSNRSEAIAWMNGVRVDNGRFDPWVRDSGQIAV